MFTRELCRRDTFAATCGAAVLWQCFSSRLFLRKPLGASGPAAVAMARRNRSGAEKKRARKDKKKIEKLKKKLKKEKKQRRREKAKKKRSGRSSSSSREGKSGEGLETQAARVLPGRAREVVAGSVASKTSKAAGAGLLPAGSTGSSGSKASVVGPRLKTRVGEAVGAVTIFVAA